MAYFIIIKFKIRKNSTSQPLTMYLDIENRIYREEFTRKKCKTAILLYCFHTAGVLHIFMLYNLLGPGISFNRKSKTNIKRKPNKMFFIHLIHYKVFFIPRDSLNSSLIYIHSILFGTGAGTP